MLPAETQYVVLFTSLLLMVLWANLRYTNGSEEFSTNKIGAIFLFIFMVTVIAWRDWRSPMFGDSYTYGLYISKAYTPESVWYAKSKLFGYLYYYWHSFNLSPELFFFFSASFYCLPMYFISKCFSKQASPWLFLLFFACSFGWYSFGVNGIRNGMAFAMLSWAILGWYKKQKLTTLFCLILAWCIHGSSMIAIGGMIGAFFYAKPQKAVLVWLSCVLFSLMFGTVAQTYFATFDFVEKDGGGYLLTDPSVGDFGFSHTGFRWDFLLFSAVPIVWGINCIKKLSGKNKIDKFYSFLLCAYIYANAVWVLAIRANYSNRLAQVSWWLIPIVMAYPLFRMNIFKNKCKTTVVVLLCYYSFTYMMYLIK